jgi:flagellar hook-associated protein 3 FlgL
MLQQTLASEEDIDMAQAVTELTAKQTAYQAALAMVSKTMNMSLMNYI